MPKLKLGVLAVAGCAVACAGVALGPVLLGGAAVGGSVAALGGEAGLAVVLALVGVAVYLGSRRRSVQACACAPDKGCKTGDDACLLSTDKGPH